MEPPEQQGCVTTGCPHCQVLYPETVNCQRCTGRSNFEAAQMRDADSIRATVAEALDNYDGTRASLDALLHLLFVYRPTSMTAFAEDGRYTLDQLRATDRAAHD